MHQSCLIFYCRHRANVTVHRNGSHTVAVNKPHPSPGILAERGRANGLGRPVFCARSLLPEAPAGGPAARQSSPAGSRPPQSPAVTAANWWGLIGRHNDPTTPPMNPATHLNWGSWTEDELIRQHVSEEAESIENLLWRRKLWRDEITATVDLHKHTHTQTHTHVFDWTRLSARPRPAELVGWTGSASGSCRRRRRARPLPCSGDPPPLWRNCEGPLTPAVLHLLEGRTKRPEKISFFLCSNVEESS